MLPHPHLTHTPGSRKASTPPTPPVAGRPPTLLLVAMRGETVAWELQGSHPPTLGVVSPSQKGVIF